MDTYFYTYQFSDLQLTCQDIELAMGNVKESTGLYNDQIHGAMAEVHGYVEIMGGYRIVEDFRVSEDGKNLFVEDVEFGCDRIIGIQLKKAEKAAIFICTAGKAISDWSKDLMKEGDLMKGYIVDSIGSAVVEQAMDMITNEHLEPMAMERDMNITNRYSPGYCNWPTKEQHKLFSLLPKDFCGVSLNDSALMSPIKSISGIIGLGSDVKNTAHQCDMCEQQDCFRRNLTGG